MIIKIIGAVLVICACTGFGFRFAALHKKCERSLVELVQVIDYLICQIKYQKTPLALLFKQAAVSTSGSLKRLLLSFGEELESQVFPDIYICMKRLLGKFPDIPPTSKELLIKMSTTLGKFDLNGQVLELEGVRNEAIGKIKTLAENRDVRLRTYQTLGLCAGAALAILFV
jgi:stage III sporulation protein AB